MATRSLHALDPLKIQLLVIDRRPLVAEAMMALRLAKHLDVVKDILPCYIPATVYTASDFFALQQLEKALSYRAVMAISSAADTLLHLTSPQEISLLITAELAALVQMYRRGLFRLETPHQPSAKHSVPVHDPFLSS